MACSCLSYLLFCEGNFPSACVVHASGGSGGSGKPSNARKPKRQTRNGPADAGDWHGKRETARPDWHGMSPCGRWPGSGI